MTRALPCLQGRELRALDWQKRSGLRTMSFSASFLFWRLGGGVSDEA